MNLKKLVEQRSYARSTKEKADITLELAISYTENDDHEAALKEYLQLLELRKSTGGKLQYGVASRFVAECYIELGEYDKAIGYTNDYLKISVELGNKVEQQRAFVTLGRCFLNRADTLKDGDLLLKNLKSASQCFFNSIKLVKELDTTADTSELPEMRAVSLLNLGQVFRAKCEYDHAIDQYAQSIRLAHKYQLQKLLFRACYQMADVTINRPTTDPLEPSDRSEILKRLTTPAVQRSLGLISTALRCSMAKKCSDAEAKDLLKNLKELLAQVYLALGCFRKAAKVYRLMKLNHPNSSDVFQQMIKTSMLLSNAFQSLPEYAPDNPEVFLEASRAHEKLGDLYSGLELNGPALVHYRYMLMYGECAHQSHSSPNHNRGELVKLIDSALVSVAETYRTLKDYSNCAKVYGREIQWATSNGMPNADIANSWFSLAQAQRLCLHPEPPASINQGNMNDSQTTVDSLNSALEAARRSSSVDLMIDILTELVDFHEQHHDKIALKAAQSELARLSTNKPRSSEGEEEEEEEEDSGSESAKKNSELDEEAVTKFTEALSSDSEVERCIGHSDILGEFHDSKGSGKRKGKALCLKTNMKGETPLHVAAINGDMDHVVKLIEVLGHPVNITDGAGWLPIHEAAFNDRTEVATYLLDRGARLDDPGCPLDCSTPLFEAIHGRALATALLLVKRGANLWHRNKQGECLPHLLDAWEPVRRSTCTFAQQRALYDELLVAIKERLGSDYDRWCNLRRCSPTRGSQSSSSSSPCSPVASSSKCTQRPTISRYRGRSFSLNLDGEEDDDGVKDVPTPARSRRTQRGGLVPPRMKSLRERGWDELLVDLDEEPTTLPKASSKKVAAVENYKQAMQAVGGSSTRSAKRRKSEGTRVHSKSKQHAHVIDADDEGWLVPDERPSKQHGGPSSTVREHFDSAGVRNTNQQTVTSPRRTVTSWAKTPRSREKLHDISNVQDTSLEFLPQTAFTSTQNPSSSLQHMKSKNLPRSPAVLSAQTSTPLITGASSDTRGPKAIPAAPLQKLAVPSDSTPAATLPPPLSGRLNPCTVKVAFADVSILVPVDDSSRSVAWLAGEAYRRRQILTGCHRNLNSALDITTVVRLSTRDGALLLNTDRLHSVIPALGKSDLVIEILAELLEPPDSSIPSTPMTSSPVVCNPLSYPSSMLSGVEQQISLQPKFLKQASTSNAQKINAIASSRFFKATLDKVRSTNVIDLSFLGLSDEDCCLILDQLLAHGIRTVTEIRLKGNRLKVSVTDPVHPDESANLLGSILARFSSCLTKLDLSANLIDLQGIRCLLEKLKNALETSPDSLVLLPRLEQLDLSYNPSLGLSVDGCPTHLRPSDSRPNAPYTSWAALLTNLTIAFPKLNYVNLAGCCLDSAFTDFSKTTGPSISESVSSDSCITVLCELDLSWNPSLSSAELLTFLSSRTFAGLRRLCLRGCSMETQRNLNIYSSSLPFSMADIATFKWGPAVDKDKTENQTRSGKHQSGSSLGDQIVQTLSVLINKGRFHLQTLDLGHCQLTYHCLDSLRSLFGTPGTSLTSVQLDSNPGLVFCSPLNSTVQQRTWVEVLQATAHSASALVSLTIDMPDVCTDDALAAAVAAVESKLLPGLSSTPLQELVLVGAPPVSDASSSTLTSLDSALSNDQKFSNVLAGLFSSRFGKLSKVKSSHDRISFGIL
ncbi:unnamed protein product [Calicophoron daubneyi]|uniref:Tonsoku-like protein n=1 Tax=Calicophoron daubneyi TaxID=300641 RepID=A0AAV2TSX8_CALDB